MTEVPDKVRSVVVQNFLDFMCHRKKQMPIEQIAYHMDRVIDRLRTADDVGKIS